MPLEGRLQRLGSWHRLIQGLKESGMVNPLKCCVLVGLDHSTGRLVGRLLWMVALIRSLVRKFMRTTERSSEPRLSNSEETPIHHLDCWIRCTPEWRT